jgi:CheY-like chemotaxis protein
MSQPVIFAIDDDAGVIAALREDLDRRFGEDFRVVGESSADAGLATLRALADTGEPVALLIVNYDLSAMPGVEFLAHAREMHPLAKRVLLVERDYSADSPVIQAMTLGQADYHITKPWLLEQDLYRLASEFLANRAKDHQAGFDLFQVVGIADRDTHELRKLLTRFNLPFRFHAASSHRGRQRARFIIKSALPSLEEEAAIKSLICGLRGDASTYCACRSWGSKPSPAPGPAPGRVRHEPLPWSRFWPPTPTHPSPGSASPACSGRTRPTHRP